jgi:hypothetical protein
MTLGLSTTLSASALRHADALGLSSASWRPSRPRPSVTAVLSVSARHHADAVGLGPASWRLCRPRPGVTVMSTLSGHLAAT